MNKTNNPLETKILNVVSSVTDVPAYFFEGTLFLKTIDSEIASNVYEAIYARVTKSLAYGKVGNETSYDIL